MAGNWILTCLVGAIFFQATSTEDVGCFVPGECTQSPYVQDWEVVSAQECLEACQDYDTCGYFTYYGLEDYCMGYSACVELSTKTCQECYTGNTTCPDLHCWIRGSCYGISISHDHVSSDNGCLDACKNDLSCTWFTYNDADGSCILFETCDDFSIEGCSTCWSGQRQCGEREDLTKIMVVAGWNFDEESIDSVDALDLTSEVQSCVSSSDYPFSGYWMVGTVFNGIPVTCGGYNDDTNLATDECYQYNFDDNIWVPNSEKMLYSREAPMASMVDSATWFITGGKSETGEILDSTEIWQGGSFNSGPKLPTAHYHHCQVTLNSSHIAILGGNNGSDSLYDFYLLDWDSQDWIEMPDIPVTLYSDPCGLIENSVNGKELVIIADYENCHIFNFRDNVWRPGPSLPDTGLYAYSAVAQMEMNFYILGGEVEGYATSDIVYEFDAENYEWLRESFSLSKPTEAAWAMPVPDHVVNCP